MIRLKNLFYPSIDGWKLSYMFIVSLLFVVLNTSSVGSLNIAVISWKRFDAHRF